VVDRGLLNRWVARALPPAAAGLPIKKFGGGGPPGALAMWPFPLRAVGAAETVTRSSGLDT
jgi:hypothetical protein